MSARTPQRARRVWSVELSLRTSLRLDLVDVDAMIEPVRFRSVSDRNSSRRTGRATPVRRSLDRSESDDVAAFGGRCRRGRAPCALAPAGNSPVGLDPARLGSLDERREATSLGLVSFESGRVDLTLEREVLLMKRDFPRQWLMTVVEVAHGYAKRIDSTICLTSLFSPAVA